MGSIVIKLPLPPACLPTLWQQDERMRESYLAEFPGYYKTADAGFKDEDGYLFIMGRTDDIINVAGHRLSTGGMEEVLAGHPDVAECAVIGIADAMKGEVPCGFVVLKAGVDARHRGDREGDRRAGAREDRPGRGVQARDHGAAAAEDALGQDPARHHEEDRRRRGMDDAGDDRGPEGAGGDRGSVEGESGGVIHPPLIPAQVGIQFAGWVPLLRGRAASRRDACAFTSNATGRNDEGGADAAQHAQQANFAKNVAIIGGLMPLVATAGGAIFAG